MLRVDVTVAVVIVKVALWAPAGTVTVEGTVALLLPEVRVTTTPPARAGPVNVTVPVLVRPPFTLEGFNLSVESAAARTVRVALLVTVPYVAEMLEVVEAATTAVVIGNAAVDDPAGMVTFCGTVAAAVLLLARDRTMPPLGAGPSSVTVPVELLPPVTAVGLRVSLENEGGLTVRVAVLGTPVDAVITTAVDALTAVVVMVKRAVVLPAATVTVAGTAATTVFALDS